MAFPQYLGSGVSNQATATTTHGVIMPGTFYAGSLLIMVAALKADAVISGMPSGWVQLLTDTQGGTNGVTLEVWYWIATTAGQGAFTYTSSSSQLSATVVSAFSAWHGTTVPEKSAAGKGTGARPDAGALTPSWGAEDTLWLPCYAVENATNSFITWPAGYTLYQVAQSSGGPGPTGCVAMHAGKELNAITDNPPQGLVSTTADWVAYNVGIRPGSVGGRPRHHLTHLGVH